MKKNMLLAVVFAVLGATSEREGGAFATQIASGISLKFSETPSRHR